MSDPELADKLAGLVVTVRDNSRRGRLTVLRECWEGPAEPVFSGLSDFKSEIGDVESIREGETDYLFSTRFMTRRYAEFAALAQTGETAEIIARTVRDESATYPRPTLVDVFAQHPYSMPQDEIAAAVTEVADSTTYPDIERVSASDGSVFLFSSRYMNRDQARSLAEWIAVGDAENP
jgi:hypothetical protein